NSAVPYTKKKTQSVESNSVGDVDSTLSTGEFETMVKLQCFPYYHSTYGSKFLSIYNSAEDSTGRGNISPCISDGQSPTRGQELRAEAKMWEMNARKLLGDLEMLRTEFSDQSKKLAGLEMDLSTAYVERDSLKKEVDHLTLPSGDSIVRQKTFEDSISQGMRRSYQSVKLREREFKVAIKFASSVKMQQLRELLSGKKVDTPQEALIVFDIVLKEVAAQRETRTRTQS
ncbi:hypothetical protein TSUD_44480, partial [Trifolium subterraneum]